MATSTVAGVLDCIGEHDETEALRAAAVEELTGVFDLSVSDALLPSALPGLADIFAWALHLEAIPEELPALAQAVAADRVDGANPRSRGELFVAENALLLGRLDAAQRTPGGADAADRRSSSTSSTGPASAGSRCGRRPAATWSSGRRRRPPR